MTVQDLQQLACLEKMIEHEKERLEALRAAVDLKSPALSDMPRAPGARDRIGDVVPAIVDQEARIEEAIREYTGLRDRILEYIHTAPNVRMRLIMTLRYIDQMTWQEVADFIGGRETEYSVKQACYRYVEGKACPGPIEGQVSLFED